MAAALNHRHSAIGTSSSAQNLSDVDAYLFAGAAESNTSVIPQPSPRSSQQHPHSIEGDSNTGSNHHHHRLPAHQRTLSDDDDDDDEDEDDEQNSSGLGLKRPGELTQHPVGGWDTMKSDDDHQSESWKQQMNINSSNNKNMHPRTFFVQTGTRDELQEIIEGIPYPDHLSMTSISNSTLSQMGSTPQRTLGTSYKPPQRSSFTRDTPMMMNDEQLMQLETSSATLNWSKTNLQFTNPRTGTFPTTYVASSDLPSENLAIKISNNLKPNNANYTTFGGGIADNQRFKQQSKQNRQQFNNIPLKDDAFSEEDIEEDLSQLQNWNIPKSQSNINMKNPSSRTSYINVQPEKSRSQIISANDGGQLGASSLSQSIHTYDPTAKVYHHSSHHEPELITVNQLHESQMMAGMKSSQNEFQFTQSSSQLHQQQLQQQQQQQQRYVQQEYDQFDAQEEQDLQVAYKEAQLEIEQLYHQLNYLSTKARQAEEQSRFAASQIDDLESNLMFLQEKYKDNGSIEKLRGHELESERAKTKRLNALVDQKTEKIQSLFNEMQKLEQHREAYMNDFKELNKARIADRQSFEQYEQSLNQLHEENQQLLFQIDQLQAAVNTKNFELDKLHQTYQQRERALNLELAKATSKIIETKDERQSPLVTQLLHQIDELKAQDTAKDLELKHLTEDLEYSQQEIAQYLQHHFASWVNSDEFDNAPLAVKLDILRNRVQELRFENEGYEVSLSETRKQQIDRVSVIHKLKGENTRLKEEVLNLSHLEDTSQNKLRLSHLDGKPSGHSQTNLLNQQQMVSDQSQDRIRELQEQLGECEAQIKAVLAHKEQLESANASLQKEIEAQQMNLDTQQRNIEAYQEQIETISTSSDNIISKLEEKIQVLTAKLSDQETKFTERCDKSAKEKDRLDRVIKEKDSNNSELLKENQMLLDNVNHLKTHYENMQSQLKASVNSLQVKQAELQQQIENSKALSRTNRNLSQTNIELLAKINLLNDQVIKETMPQLDSPNAAAAGTALPPYHNKAKSTSNAAAYGQQLNLVDMKPDEDDQMNKYKRNFSAHQQQQYSSYNNYMINDEMESVKRQSRPIISVAEVSKKASVAHSKASSSSDQVQFIPPPHPARVKSTAELKENRRSEQLSLYDQQQQQQHMLSMIPHYLTDTLKQSSSEARQQNVSLLHSQSQTGRLFGTPSDNCERCVELQSELQALTKHFESLSEQMQHYDADFNQMKSTFLEKLAEKTALIAEMKAKSTGVVDSQPSPLILPEMLSKDETLDLMSEILRKVLRSDKMRSAIIASNDIQNLISIAAEQQQQQQLLSASPSSSNQISTSPTYYSLPAQFTQQQRDSQVYSPSDPSKHFQRYQSASISSQRQSHQFTQPHQLPSSGMTTISHSLQFPLQTDEHHLHHHAQQQQQPNLLMQNTNLSYSGVRTPTNQQNPLSSNREKRFLLSQNQQYNSLDHNFNSRQ